MNNSDILTQLARRMGVSEEQASDWLAAVLDILHGRYAAGGGGNEDAPRSTVGKGPGQSPAPLPKVKRVAL